MEKKQVDERSKENSRGKSQRTNLDFLRRWSRVDYLSRQQNGKVLSRRMSEGERWELGKADCLWKKGIEKEERRGLREEKGRRKRKRKLFRLFLSADTAVWKLQWHAPSSLSLLRTFILLVFHPRDVDGQGQVLSQLDTLWLAELRSIRTLAGSSGGEPTRRYIVLLYIDKYVHVQT